GPCPRRHLPAHSACSSVPVSALPSLLSRSAVRRPPSSTLFPYTTLFRSLPLLLEALATRRLPADSAYARIGIGAGFWSLAFFLRSEEHTSELQSRFDLVCRLLLEKKKDGKATEPVTEECASAWSSLASTP